MLVQLLPDFILQHMVYVNIFLKNKTSREFSFQVTLHEVIATPLEIIYQLLHLSCRRNYMR